MVGRLWLTATRVLWSAGTPYVAVFHCCSIFCFSASATAHALGPVVPLERSRSLWRTDLKGIVIQIGGSFVPGLRWGFRCRPVAMGTYAGVLLPLQGWSLSLSSAPVGSPKNKLFVRIASASATWALLPLCHFCTFATREELVLGVLPTFAMLACYGLGLLFFLFHPIERLWPGMMDDLGGLGSHFVWHLCCVAAVYLWDLVCQRLLDRSWDPNACH